MPTWFLLTRKRAAVVQAPAGVGPGNCVFRRSTANDQFGFNVASDAGSRNFRNQQIKLRSYLTVFTTI
jgi:hypothetical protein